MVRASSTSTSASATKKSLEWRPTKMMNMVDLSRDDDFLSHLLVEKLGTGDVPLLVHKMDLSRRLPKVPASQLLEIVKHLIANNAPIHHSIRQAVDELLSLHPVQYFLEGYTQQQINAFATHASRYFELYHPSGCIEIAHTSRYAHRTGKSELCILATRPLAIGSVITELKGSMANLTDEEDRELQRTLRNGEIRRDFSVIHSKSMKKNHLFLGPARFVNHDCNNNCELFREGRYITFRVLRPIAIGEEITAHYGDSYFGKRNRHCLCETCEKRGVGGYWPDAFEEEPGMNYSDTDGYSSDVGAHAPVSGENEPESVNPNERRTRRGVYAVLPDDPNKRVTASAPPKIPESSTGATQTSVSASLSTDAPATNLLGKHGDPVAVNNIAGPSSRTIEDLIDTSRASSASTSTPPPLQPVRSSSRLAQKGAVSTSSLSRASSKGKGKEIKDEPQEVKIPPPPKSAPPKTVSSRSTPATKVDGTPPSPPRGPSGKPLPTCATCNNVLPLIHVDHKLVWGYPHEEEASRRKPVAQDCPRCMRHLAIYGFTWPHRDGVSSSAATNQIGRASSTASDHKREASTSQKRKLEEREEPAVKARKVDVRIPEPVKTVIKPQIMNGKLVRRGINGIDPATGRPRRGRPPNKPSSGRSASSSVNETEPAPEKDTNATPQPTSSVKTVSPKVKPLKLFPANNIYHNRRPNGQLDTSIKSYAITKGAPRVAPPENEDSLRRSARKRGLQAEPLMIERTPPRKLSKTSDSPPISGIDEEEAFISSESELKISFKMGLYRRPNPFSFSKETWSSSVYSTFDDDDDASITAESTPDVYNSATSDESEYPVTPDDGDSSTPIVVDGADADDVVDVDSLEQSLPLLRKPTLLKPSPFSFAKKRWATTDQEPTDAERFDALFPSTSTPASSFKLDDTVMSDFRASERTAGPYTAPVFSLLGKSYSLPQSKNVSWTKFLNDEHDSTLDTGHSLSNPPCSVSTRT